MGPSGHDLRPEPWAEIGGRTWSHFDRWYALVIVHDHDGDPGGLQADLVGRLRSLSGRDDVEAKLAHLAWLVAQLDGAGLRFEDLAGGADTAIRVKALRKVLDQALEGRSTTPAMLGTPAPPEPGSVRALASVPAPVKPWYDQLEGQREGTGGVVTVGRSFNAARRLGRRLGRLDAKRLAVAERLSLHRAFHSVALDLADSVDDSYGTVGDLREEAFTTYLALDLRATGIDPAAYWQDLCELLIWEPYGLGFRTPEAPFQHVKVGEAAHIERALLALAEEHRAAHSTGRPRKHANRSPGSTSPANASPVTSTPPGSSAPTTGCRSSPWPSPPSATTTPPSPPTPSGPPTGPADTATPSATAAAAHRST